MSDQYVQKNSILHGYEIALLFTFTLYYIAYTSRSRLFSSILSITFNPAPLMNSHTR